MKSRKKTKQARNLGSKASALFISVYKNEDLLMQALLPFPAFRVSLQASFVSNSVPYVLNLKQFYPGRLLNTSKFVILYTGQLGILSKPELNQLIDRKHGNASTSCSFLRQQG